MQHTEASACCLLLVGLGCSQLCVQPVLTALVAPDELERCLTAPAMCSLQKDALECQCVANLADWIAILLIVLCRRRVRRVEEGRAAARRAAAQATGADAAAPALADDDDREGDTCVICLEARCQTVFPSCGHMCTCLECSRNLNRCPICRTKSRAITVYRP